MCGAFDSHDEPAFGRGRGTHRTHAYPQSAGGSPCTRTVVRATTVRLYQTMIKRSSINTQELNILGYVSWHPAKTFSST